ncbi:MAG: hypothetical protein SFV54_28790 [Bryobacteraceae bacterium]|nr:hypothetical protein [Bryobacteraceae bacterium]
MWRAAVLLAAAAGMCPAEEDLRSAAHWLKKANPELTRFHTYGKRAVDGTYSVMAITGWAGGSGVFGVFVVYGKTNQVYQALEIGAAPRGLMPHVRNVTEERAYVDWFGDYGVYGGTRKYAYSLRARSRPERYTYRRFEVESASAAGSELVFAGRYSAPAELESDPGFTPPLQLLLTVDGRWRISAEAETPNHKPRDRGLPALPDGAVAVPERLVKVDEAVSVYAAPGEAALGGAQRSGVWVLPARGRAAFYPVPVPSLALYQSLRQAKGAVAFTPGPAASGLVNAMGPIAFDGERLWFGNDFYDGEGTSGVGGLGSFDVRTRRYEMRYLPELAPWAASALKLHEGALWIALMRRPEGMPYGGGVLRYDLATNVATPLPIEPLVSSITAWNGALYFATANGVYEVKDGVISHIRLEPESRGPREVVQSCVSGDMRESATKRR